MIRSPSLHAMIAIAVATAASFGTLVSGELVALQEDPTFCIAAAALDAGAKLKIAKCDSGNELQNWSSEMTSSGDILWRIGDDLCVEATNLQKLKAMPRLNKCRQTKKQRWAQNAGAHDLRPAKNSDLCIIYSGTYRRLGRNVKLRKCSGGANQGWLWLDEKAYEELLDQGPAVAPTPTATSPTAKPPTAEQHEKCAAVGEKATDCGADTTPGRPEMCCGDLVCSDDRTCATTPARSEPPNNTKNKPNILFIPVDDLNNWVGYFSKHTSKGNKQSMTPNLDRLSALGMSFTNAHAPSTICNPSRAAVWSGVRPTTSGCYDNKDYPWKSYIKSGLGLNSHFKENGYYVAGMGKTYHSSQQGIEKSPEKIYKDEWDDYPKRVTTKAWDKITERAGFTEPLKVTLKHKDEPDWHTTDYCIDRIMEDAGKRKGKPLFLACGLVKPHLPWAVPNEYYDLYPKGEVELPPYPSTNDWKDWNKAIKDDLKDVPKYAIKEFSKIDKEYAEVMDLKVWESSIQSYLATIVSVIMLMFTVAMYLFQKIDCNHTYSLLSFQPIKNYMDMNVGRILDAYEKSPEKDNTIIVLWSDHGKIFILLSIFIIMCLTIANSYTLQHFLHVHCQLQL